MTHTVVGLFNSRSEAQTAMRELVAQGFAQESVDLSNRTYADSDAGTTGATDADYAGTTGANEGIGDRIANFFSSLFDDEPTARSYTNAAYDADAILTVQADSDERARQAADILDRHGAIDVDNDEAGYGDDSSYGAAGYVGGSGHNTANYDEANYAATPSAETTSNTTGTMDAGTMDTMRDATTSASANLRSDANLEDEAVIPVVEENLEVGKRAVERGGARIRSRVIERPVEEHVRLREEHVVVNRRPVDRAVTDADLSNFREGDIELTERAEVPVISKQARVVEEVEIGKTVEERDETVRDTVRRTDVEVEEIDGDATGDDLHTGSRRVGS